MLCPGRFILVESVDTLRAMLLSSAHGLFEHQLRATLLAFIDAFKQVNECSYNVYRQF